MTYGSNMTEALITEMLPASDPLVIFTKMVFIVNLLCSYALTICPTNRIIEGWLFKKGDNSTATYWMQNFSRTLVALSACFFGVMLASKIDKFLGLMGALLCAPLALLFPTFCHIKLIAKTPKEKMIDFGVILIGFFVLIFSTTQSLLAW